MTAKVHMNEKNCLAANCLSALKYENTLLKERNRVLAEQNENLLAQIQDERANKQNIHSKINQMQDEKRNKYKEDKKQKTALLSFLTALQNYFFTKQQQSSASSLDLVKKLIENKCPMHSIFEGLQGILEHKIQSIKEREEKSKDDEKKNNLERLTEIMKRRKQNHNKKEKNRVEYLHIVKQPQWKRDTEESDIDFLMRYCQKVTRSTMRNQIGRGKMEGVFKKMREMWELRKEVKIIGRSISENERQGEFGIQNGLVLGQLYNNLKEVQENYNNSIKQFDELLISLLS